MGNKCNLCTSCCQPASLSPDVVNILPKQDLQDLRNPDSSMMNQLINSIPSKEDGYNRTDNNESILSLSGYLFNVAVYQEHFAVRIKILYSCNFLTKSGCIIYEQRPSVCRKFACATIDASSIKKIEDLVSETKNLKEWKKQKQFYAKNITILRTIISKYLNENIEKIPDAGRNFFPIGAIA